MELYSKLGLGGVATVVLSLVIGFWGFWAFTTYKIKTSVTLAPGSDVRAAWQKAPIAIDFNVYIFNITNPWDVHNGSKPRLEQIGPYTFYEWKEKVNVVDHPDNDTVSFNMKTTWYFDPVRSGGLTMDETVVVPHIAMLGLVYIVEKRKPGSLRVVNKAVPALYGDPGTAFLTTSVRDLLFEGNAINCTSTEFAATALCTAIRAQSAGLHHVSDDVYKFSVFGVKNNTPEVGRFNVRRGTQDYRQVGQVLLYNHEPQLYVWDGPECNRLRGTDSTVFPALLTPQDDIVSFAPDLCRSISAKFQMETEYMGVAGNLYNASLGDMSSNPDEKCFCPSPDTCLKKGSLDLTECLESPMIVTLPHFYDADPSYLDTVEGLEPDPNLHQILLIFEPMTGTPLSVRKRLQFNIYLHAVKKVKILSTLPDAMLPIMWVEEGLDLNATLLGVLQGSLFNPIRANIVGRWLFFSLGLILIILASGLWYSQKKKVRRGATPRRTRSNPTQVMDLSESSFKY